MERLTTQEIEAIRKRVEQATEGPWKDYVIQFGCNRADAEFTANAREDIPKLLAEVERLRSTLSKISGMFSYNADVRDARKLAKEAIEYANEELR